MEYHADFTNILVPIVSGSHCSSSVLSFLRPDRLCVFPIARAQTVNTPVNGSLSANWHKSPKLLLGFDTGNMLSATMHVCKVFHIITSSVTELQSNALDDTIDCWDCVCSVDDLCGSTSCYHWIKKFRKWFGVFQMYNKYGLGLHEHDYCYWFLLNVHRSMERIGPYYFTPPLDSNEK